MAKSISWAERLTNGSILVDLGYRDYIAARFLLNNRYIVQGLTLASTAVEKYLKSLIAFNLKEKKRYDVHLSNLAKLKRILNENNCDVTNNLDLIFLNILEQIYKIRYYDTLKKPISIGFYLNQFIGELDNTIYLLETSLNPEASSNSITPYKRALKNKDPHLLKNNFVLKKQDKKTFMEKPTTAFSIHVYVSSPHQIENTAVGKNIKPPKYEGQLSTFTEFLPDWSVPK
jgi:HEPN domain-containing protein